ncbi:signal peptide peptidase SppA, partial [Thalassospira xiamenensis]
MVFFLVLALVIIALTSEDDPIVVPENAILVLNPQGIVVEEKTHVDPVQKFLDEALGSGPENPEVLLSDIITTIERAQADEDIGALLLDLSGLRGAGVNKLQRIGAALDEFKTSGKPIIASADFYTQSQYYLAAHADSVYLNPLGGVDLQGFGYYQLYFKDMLEKLKVSSHVFKAGAYKSAVEPYTRNDMSDEAREASSELYDALWQAFKDDLMARRDISSELLNGDFEDFLELFAQADADSATFALQTGLVDALKTREELRTELINLSGFDEEKESYKSINYNAYLTATRPAPEFSQQQ